MMFIKEKRQLREQREKAKEEEREGVMKLYVSKDGYLDAGEVALWILPGEIDHADNEAKHLIHETDTDKVNCHCSDFMSMRSLTQRTLLFQLYTTRGFT